MTKQTWKAASAAVFAAVVAMGTLGITGSGAKVAAAATNIYVSPRGNDSADGSFERPFATFGRRVHGYMSVPTDKSKAPFAVDFEVNAAGFGDWTNDMKGSRDAISVRFSVYPFAPDWKWRKSGLEAKYKEMDASLAAHFGAPRYCQAGITESRED